MRSEARQEVGRYFSILRCDEARNHQSQESTSLLHTYEVPAPEDALSKYQDFQWSSVREVGCEKKQKGKPIHKDDGYEPMPNSSTIPQRMQKSCLCF